MASHVMTRAERMCPHSAANDLRTESAQPVQRGAGYVQMSVTSLTGWPVTAATVSNS